MRARILAVTAATLFALWIPTVRDTGSCEGPGPQEAPTRPPSLEPLPPRTGFIPNPLDLSHLKGDRMPRGVSTQSLPDSWDWRALGKVTSVKNQGQCGSCYAFAAVASFESKLLIDGAGSYDLSENNAKECNWPELHDVGCGSCDGGNHGMVTDLFSQKGTVLESCDPYQDRDVACKSWCPYQKTLLDWRLISDGVPGTDVLKAYIRTYGPVYAALNAGHDDAWEDEFHAYDGSYTMYHPGTEGTNHAVTIVGWDDSLTHAGGTGGWIVKNSWGQAWGNGGFFTIAYGSARIGTRSSFLYDWQDYDPDGGLMYYDDAGWTADWGCSSTTVWGLCKFYPTETTRVTQVEFFTTDATTDVDVYIYNSFNGTSLSNLLFSRLNLAYDEAGYHSVAVSPPLPVRTGDDVAAVVKLTNSSYVYPLAADSLGPSETARTYISCSGGDGTWTDLGIYANDDVAIRLRTSASEVPPPVDIDAIPLSFEVTLAQGETTSQVMTIANVGEGGLIFEISESATVAASTVPVPTRLRGHTTIVDEEKPAHSETIPQPRLQVASGGPDAFGYTFQDSDDPGGSVYSWIEVAPPAGGSGTEISGLTGVDDGHYWPLTLPFAFNFYGTDHTSLAVSSNGTLYFENEYFGYSNLPIPGPNAYDVETFIAPFWDDLVIDPGAVYYQTYADRAIVEFYRVRSYGGSEYGTWETILFANGDILFQYKDVVFDSSRDYGGRATVGIQRDVTTGLQYSYDTSALSNNLAILFTYLDADVPWLSENPIMGTVQAGTSVPVVVTFDATELSQGTHTADLIIANNDPDENPVIVPVTLYVPSAVDIDVTPPSIEVTLAEGESTTELMTIRNTGSGTLTFDVTDEETSRPSATIEFISRGPLPEGAGNLSSTRSDATELSEHCQQAAAYHCDGALDALDILVYADDSGSVAGSAYVEQALQSLGYAYTGYFGDPHGFGSALTTLAWDLVIVAHDRYFSLGDYWSEMESHFNSGGKIIIATFDVDGSNSESTTLWATLGLSYASDIVSPANVYDWSTRHPVWAGVPVFATWDELYGDNGDKIDTLAGTASIGGFTASAASGQAAIVVRNDRRAIVNSFITDEHRTDDDGDGTLDTIELWKNEISYVLGSGTEAPWLSESPTSGSVSPSGSQSVSVTFDATGLPEGTYTANLAIANNDPDENPVIVPVTLHVTTGGVRLYLTPPSTTTYVGAILRLDVMVDASIQPINNVELYINFNPSLLQVVDASGNPTSTIEADLTHLSTELLNSVNNAAGEIRYDAGKLSGTSPTGTFRVASIRFETLAVTTGTTVSYVAPSDVFYGGAPVLGSTEGATVVAGAGCLVGRVSLQSHPSPAGYQVRVSPFEQDVVLDASGVFTVCGIAGGTYDVEIKGSHSLSSLRTGVTIPSGPTQMDFCTLLEGDANGDNRVSGVDFSILATTYGKSSGDTGFDTRADFNDDECVLGVDFSLLATNYNRSGPVPCVPSASADSGQTESGATMAVTGAVDLEFSPTSFRADVGDILTVDLKIVAGTQPMNNVELYIDFDTALLQVVDTGGNPTSEVEADLSELNSELLNEVDNSTGRIRYDAGKLTGTQRTGTFRVATVRFKVIEAAATSIRFVAPSNVFYQGDSVVGALGSAEVTSGVYAVCLPLVMKTPG